MGTPARCLCLILTLLIAGSRPSTGVWNGPSDSDPWWGTQDAKEIRQSFDRYLKAGNYSAYEATAQRGYDLAIRFGSRPAAVRYLINLGSARFQQYHYRSTLDAYLAALKLARSIRDEPDEAATLANLSSLYLEMSDLEASLQYAGQARSKTHGHPYFEYQLLLHLAKLYTISGDPRAEAALAEEIDAARAHLDFRQEARGWDYLGDLRLRAGKLDQSEAAFTEAFRIRKSLFKADLPYSYARFGSLRLAQARFEEAERFTNFAIDSNSAFPRFLLIHQRAEIRLARGEKRAALSDLEQSAELATDWRQEVLPGISTLTETNVALQKQVFDSLIELAAEQDKPLESLAALEQNRATTLRVEGWQKRLPVRYWDVLGELRKEESRIGKSPNPNLQRFRTELTAMESESGLRIFPKKEENFSPQKTLNHFRRVLSTTDLFLSFHLGETASYMWTVTAGSVKMHRLAPAGELRKAAFAFRNAVRDGLPEAVDRGGQLYRMLFGGLSPEETAKSDWMIAADDALYEVPFSALVTDGKVGLKFLIEEHSLRLVPGAWSLASSSPAVADLRPAGMWLGVGDPIYNSADARWSATHSFPFVVQSKTETQLTRLVASSGEISRAARSWGGPSATLEGARATRENFQAATTATPAVIHLATHVLTESLPRTQALIAFAIDRSGQPQYLSTSDIAAMRVPGAIVAMTGCSTGSGAFRQGAGLLGLTRAWELAGARSVVATLWPVSDSDGGIFDIFYRQLHNSTPAARALQRSQIEMIHSRSWRSEPRYWASYQIMGGRN